MLMSEVRNQRHVWLSILPAMGYSMADINSAGPNVCQGHRAPHAQGHADRLHLRLPATAVGRRCSDDAGGFPQLRLRAVPHRRSAGGGLEQAAARLHAVDVALRQGRRRHPAASLKLRPAAVQWRLSVATEGTALVIPSFSMLSLVQSLELSRDGRGSDN